MVTDNRMATREKPARRAVALKRAYDPATPADGYRVLVDRIWPRGIRREALRIDEWARDLAPSDGLRRWFGHEVDRWPEFQERYRGELAAPATQGVLASLEERARTGQLTLVFGAADREHNNAVVLAEVMAERLERSTGDSPVSEARAAIARSGRSSAH